MLYKEIKNCRACGSFNINDVFELGDQYLSGVFRFENLDKIINGPLTLVCCDDCKLVQLRHSYPLDEMYNEGYGYQSGLTSYMKLHLQDIVKLAKKIVHLEKNDVVLDIGSNDGTLLTQYGIDVDTLIGIDPVAIKYLDFYPNSAKVVTDFFSKQNYYKTTTKKSKVVTSVSMFYDLEDPLKFAKDIAEVVSDDGVWIFEQSYLPAMLRNNSYDSICHEHLEYYSLTAIKNILDKANFKIIDVSQNEVNGGSIRVAAVLKSGKLAHKSSPLVNWLLEQENIYQLHNIEIFRKFKKDVERHKNDLVNLLNDIKKSGKKVFGYGASTKGNVILQFCEIGVDLIEFIGDITPSKHGAYTPGTGIPIISMEHAKELKPDYFLVLPWGFRNDIILREKDLINSGVKFIFPLPHVEIVG